MPTSRFEVCSRPSGHAAPVTGDLPSANLEAAVRLYAARRRSPSPASGRRLSSSSTTRPPTSARRRRAAARSTEPRPWRISIGRPTRAARRSAADPVASSSGTPASGTKTRARIDPRRLVEPRPDADSRSPGRSPSTRRPRPATRARRNRTAAPTPVRGDRGELAVEAHRDLSGGRSQHVDVDALARSSHAVPTSGWPANGSSTSGVKIRSSPRSRVVDEHRLGEAELAGDPLALAAPAPRRRRGRRRARCRRRRRRRRRRAARGARSAAYVKRRER